MAHWLRGSPQVDIAILTVIPPELFAVRDALGIPESARSKDEAGTISYRCRVRSVRARRDYEVILTCIGRAGNALSAAAVQDIISRYHPKAVLLVGIAAGVRGKVRIGDVVLSERVVAYEPAAVVRTPEGGSRLDPRPELRTIPHRMFQDVVHYQPDEARLEARFLRKGAFPLPPAGNEALYRAHVAPRLTVKVATVASGEKLLRDPGKLLEIRSLHGKTEVGEMEAVGLMEACERSGVPWLVIRGISDFGDEFKDDRFHDLASRAASAVMADFIEHGLELEKQKGRGTMAVATGALLVAAIGIGVPTWAALHGKEQSQPIPAIASEQTASKGDTKPPTASAQEPAPALAPAKDTPVQERKETPPSSGGPKRQSPAAPQPQPAPAAAESKPTAGSAPTMKTKIGTLEFGDGAKIKLGNVSGEGSADTQVENVTCGDNCELEAGNKTR